MTKLWEHFDHLIYWLIILIRLLVDDPVHLEAIWLEIRIDEIDWWGTPIIHRNAHLINRLQCVNEHTVCVDNDDNLLTVSQDDYNYVCRWWQLIENKKKKALILYAAAVHNMQSSETLSLFLALHCKLKTKMFELQTTNALGLSKFLNPWDPILSARTPWDSITFLDLSVAVNEYE